MPRLALFLPALALVALTTLPACAPTGAEATQRGGRGPITQQDIEASRVSTSAYDVIQSLRPEWLITRGAQTLADNQPGIVVYVNDTRFGSGTRVLQDIDAPNIRRIERLDHRQATTRFGSGHFHGAILITLR